MKTLLIYPVTKDVISILRYRNLISGYEKVIGCCLEGDYKESEDLSYLDNGERIGLECLTEIECMEEVDDILFAQVNCDNYFESYFLPFLQKYSIEEKKIGFLFPVSDVFFNKVLKTGKIKAENLIDLKGCWDNEEGDEMYPISVPVIFVCGTAEDTDKFELQLRLRREMLKNCYRISQIGTKYYSPVFGFHAVPDFMFSDSESAERKIIKWNHFVKWIEENEDPDVILIGVPGGVLKETETMIQEYGLTAYEMSAAVPPDYVYLCIYENDVNIEYLKELIQKLNHKYDFEINQIAVSNSYFDYMKTLETGEKDLLKLPCSMVEKKIGNNKEAMEPVYLSGILEAPKEKTDRMIRNLSANVESDLI